MYVYTYIYIYIYRNGRATQRTKKLYIHRRAENWAWELSLLGTGEGYDRVAYDRELRVTTS